MSGFEWIREFSGSITVCDREGTILYMNDKAVRTFEKYGGAELVGRSLFDCHPEAANAKIREMLETGAANSYTIEKQGARKLIHQAPWYQDGNFMGLVELSLEIPAAMPHFIRK